MRYTYADYLALEDASPIRHEYLDGEIYAMAGGIPDHAALAVQVLTIIRGRLPADAGRSRRTCVFAYPKPA